MVSLIRTFGISRMAVGALCWAAPETAGRSFGLRDHSDPVITQLFGARDFTLGAATVCSTGAGLARVLQVGVANDVADVIGCLRQRDHLSLQAKVLVPRGAVLFAGIGVVSLSGLASEN